jgi:hypothetical protein
MLAGMIGVAESKFGGSIRRIIAWLKRLPGNVRSRFARDIQRVESLPGSREPVAEAPKGDELHGSFRFDEDDLAFLSEVARRLAPLTAQPSLAPEEAKAIGRAVAALQKLPELTPGIDVRIEVAHRMGGEELSESYSYAVKLDQRRIEITSSGSQSGPTVGSDSFSLESLKWYANGQTAHQGNRDTWLERLSYALARDHSLHATDESGGQCAGTV